MLNKAGCDVERRQHAQRALLVRVDDDQMRSVVLCHELRRTLERFRGRGTQNALLHARLSAAIQIGCTLATSGTPPGTSSHRNMERHGFRVAYTRTKLFKPNS